MPPEGRVVNPYKRYFGCWTPNWLAEREDVRPGAKMVWARLAQYAGAAGVADPDMPTLAKSVGMCQRQCHTYINQLIEAGVLLRERVGYGKSNRYTFVEPEYASAAGYCRQQAADPVRQDTADPTSIHKNQLKKKKEPAAPPESVSPKVDVDPILEELPAPLDTPDFREAWEQWKQYRRERKAPLTKSTKEKQLIKLAAWGPARAIVALDWTITNGWQGIFEPKDGAGKPVVSHVAAPQLRQRLDREGEDRRARVAAEVARDAAVARVVDAIAPLSMPALISEYIAWTGRPNARAPDPATNQPFRQWLFDKFSERKEGAA